MQTTASLNTCFRKMTGLRFVYMACFFLTKGNLYGGVAVSFFGFYLCNAVSRHFQHGYRDRFALLCEDTCHTNFASNQT